MKSFILGKKIGMTQIFDENGVCIPVTVVVAGPCTVVQKKTIENDSYESVKIGFTNVESKKLNKPDLGVYEKLGINPVKYLKEFKPDNASDFEIGQELKIDTMFKEGDRVDISGTSKGKGFQGAIKRHGQKIGPRTHGSKFHRGIGSMGSNTDPGKVFKGKKMPGHMGFVRITVQNLDIVKVDVERGLLLIKGAVPGAKGTILEIRESIKSR